VSFQCFAERKIFASPRFLLHGSERCRRRVRTTGIAGLVSTWMTGTICGSSPGTVIKKRAALRAAEADHNAYGHMGFPGWRVSMKNHSISSSSQKENCPTIKNANNISYLSAPHHPRDIREVVTFVQARKESRVALGQLERFPDISERTRIGSAVARLKVCDRQVTKIAIKVSLSASRAALSSRRINSSRAERLDAPRRRTNGAKPGVRARRVRRRRDALGPASLARVKTGA
jgi:hypothetical protein